MQFIIIYVVLITSVINISQQAQTTPAVTIAQPELTLSIFYLITISTNQSELFNTSVYRNGILSQQFIADSIFVSCANLNLFILNRTNTNPQYFWVISNYTQQLNVTLITQLKTDGPVLQNFTCNISNTTINQCNITIQTFCTQDKYSYNIIYGTIMTKKGQVITQFTYNLVCNADQFQHYFQIQWGTVIIVIYSIIMIFSTSRFQQAKSFSNIVFYINYVLVGIYCLFSLICFILIAQKVPHTQEALLIFYLIISLVFGIIGIIVCFSQFAYATRIKCFRVGYYNGKIRFRIMDFIGLCIALGLFSGWFLDYRNWFISNTIFTCILVALVKIVKLGSLKIALIIFTTNLIINLAFGNTVEIMNSTYTNSNFYAFNNPLFFLIPLIAKIPNRQCAWHFIFQMAYPGLFLAYLVRFDKNRSSSIYGATFMISYVVCTIFWFVVNYFVPIALPFDLFTVPIAMVFIILFANRRGQLTQLWSGEFYDQQKTYYQNQQEIVQKLRMQKSTTYDERMFQNLKIQANDDQSHGSKFSQIIKTIQIQKLKKKSSFQITQMNYFRNGKQIKPDENHSSNTDKSQVDQDRDSKIN